ncbi:hypothetical protein L6303_07850 [archaeon]|nr:hypothetical protein [Nanoarchaeota archaeon]MBU4299935.1 hypothetical protein [Nanoarchaeota archaeon]MBU4452414.1 hypothetical protein [Nanoarchaeota archaeon]MCG2724628.1 hypothetical protein [archaeon]
MDSQKTSISLELEALKKEITKVTENRGGLDIDCDLTNESEDKREIKDTSNNNVSILITYSLLKKNRSKKMLFNYELIGRNGKDGLLQTLNGEKVTSGCFIAPKDKENSIDEFLKKHDIEFSKRNITLINN